jgi:hypothetical protein
MIFIQIPEGSLKLAILARQELGEIPQKTLMAASPVILSALHELAPGVRTAKTARPFYSKKSLLICIVLVTFARLEPGEYSEQS